MSSKRMYKVVKRVEKIRRLRTAAILGSFIALFGGGLVVYGVALAEAGPTDANTTSAHVESLPTPAIGTAPVDTGPG